MVSQKTNIKLVEFGIDASKQDLCNTSRRGIIMDKLLKTLLRRVSTVLKIKNSFAKFEFYNSNSYCGWLNSNGFNGFGTYTFEIGQSYKGTFEGSLTKGLGSLNYINGDIYEGEFLAGRPHGYGHYKSDQFKYRGYFQNGMFHGNGLWKTRSEEIEGIFHIGKIKSGEARCCNGILNGIFVKSALKRWGKFKFNNGNTYNGFCSDNNIEGFGEYSWATEDRSSMKEETNYVGYWWNGKRHGLGMLTFNQMCVICQWSFGKKNGAGIIITCNGSCYSGKEMFIFDRYNESNCIRSCQETQKILSEAINIFTLDSKYQSPDEIIFLNIIERLLEEYSVFIAPINPMRIPNYEIPTNSFISFPESKHLQQILVENLITFRNLYKKYIHPPNHFVNHIGLNLFYIDVFHKVRDINIAKELKAGHLEISRFRINSNDASSSNLNTVVTFYEFFQHFVNITKVLMENDPLKSKADEMTPTFFGHLAARVLLVLKILQANESSLFLVKEGICANLPSVLKLQDLLDELFHGEKTLRTAYKFLKLKGVINGSTEFLTTIERFYDVKNASVFLFDNQLELSPLELIEIIFRTCKLKLTNNITSF